MFTNSTGDIGKLVVKLGKNPFQPIINPVLCPQLTQYYLLHLLLIVQIMIPCLKAEFESCKDSWRCNVREFTFWTISDIWKCGVAVPVPSTSTLLSSHSDSYQHTWAQNLRFLGNVEQSLSCQTQTPLKSWQVYL